MEDSPQPRLASYYRRGLVAGLGALTAILAVAFLWRTMHVWLMFAVAGLLAYLLAGPIDWLTRHWGRRRLFTVIVFVGFVLLLLGLFSSFIPIVVTQTRELIENAPSYVSQLESRYRDIGARVGIDEPELRLSEYLSQLRQRVESASPDIFNKVLGYGKTVLSGTAVALTWLFLIPLIALYLLLDADRLRKQLMTVFLERHQPSVDQALTAINKTLGSYIYSRVVLALIVWVSYTLLLLFMDVPYSLLLGILAFIGEFIPVVGGLMAFIPIVLIVLITAPAKLIWIVVIIAIIQGLQSYVVAPKIMGEAMDIHPLTVVVAMLVGGTLGGGLGLLLAVPVAAAIKAMYTVFHKHKEELLGVNLGIVDLVRRQTDANPTNDPIV